MIELPFPRATRDVPSLSPALLALGISLRPSRRADLPELARAYSAFRMPELLHVSMSDADKHAFIDQQFRLQHAHLVARFRQACFWTARDAGHGFRTIGRLYLDRSAGAWRMIDVLLAPHAQGRGVGTALVRWMQSSAIEAGAEGIDLHVAIDNPRARALYLRLGFADIAGGNGLHLPMRWLSPAG